MITKTILWQQPNGTLALTSVLDNVLVPQQQAAAWLASCRTDAEYQAEIVAHQDALLPAPKQQDYVREGLVNVVDADGNVIGSRAAMLFDKAAHDAACAAVQDSNTPHLTAIESAEKALASNQNAREVEALLGLSVEQYAQKLQLPGRGVPADWVMLGFDIPFPETGWKHEAHRFVNGTVIADVTAAKEETKQRLRAEREPLLQAQDVAFQRALETGADTSLIVAEKQRLRDVTRLADVETSLEGLKAIRL